MSASLWLLIPLIIICLTGMSLNAYLLLVISLSKQFASVNNLLLLHLAALNILLGATFLTFSTPGLQGTAQWSINGFACELHGFLFTFLHPVVIWTICGLNADRYYAIAAPLHYGRIVNPKKALWGLAIGWVNSLVFAVPPLLGVAKNHFNDKFGACIPDFHSSNKTLWFAASSTAFTLLLPLTLIICCNVKILLIARYHRHRIASAIYEVTLSAQVTITHQRNPFFVPTVTAPGAGGPRFRSRSPISTVLQLLGSFILLYVPYYVLILWQSSLTFLNFTTDRNHYRFILVLLSLSPTVNCFLYGLRNKPLRKTIQNYWRKKMTKSEVNHEIQARTPSTCGSRRQSLTPLGFFLFKTPSSTYNNIPRRLSEALIREDSERTQIKRASSELSDLRNVRLPHSPKAISHAPNKSAMFLKKMFGTNTPKILITRALSDQHNAEEPSEKILSTCSLSRLKSYDRFDCFEPSSDSKLLKQYETTNSDYLDDAEDGERSPSSTSVDYMPTSDASSGLYMNLDLDADADTTLSSSDCQIKDYSPIKEVVL